MGFARLLLSVIGLFALTSFSNPHASAGRGQGRDLRGEVGDAMCGSESTWKEGRR